MDRVWVAEQLAQGRSIESIAREVDRDPSTVSYWVKRFGLRSTHSSRVAPRGGIPSDVLEALTTEGLSSYAIAQRLGVSQSTVRHWLRKHGLRTARSLTAKGVERSDDLIRMCRTHGETKFVRYSRTDHYRCLRCRKEGVVARRRRVKEILVEEAGGRCRLCGYDRFAGALHFHHLDPATKEFGLGLRGLARGIERCREEARKCVLLCANCHAEVEWGRSLDYPHAERYLPG